MDIQLYGEYLKKLFDGESLFEQSYKSKPRINQLIHIIEFVIQSYEEDNQFYNVTQDMYNIMNKVIDEIDSLVHVKDFHLKQKMNYFTWIVKTANIMTPHRLF